MEDKLKFDVTESSHYDGEILVMNTENNWKDWNKHRASDTNYNSTIVIERVKATLSPAFYFPKAVGRKVRWLF